MYSGKEATRDGAERMNLEAAIEQLTDGFFSLVANIGTEDIPVQLFSEDIEAIVKSGMEDVIGLFSSGFKPDMTMTAGDLSIDPKKLKGIEYRFNIDTNSTMKIQKEKQLETLTNLMGTIGKFQNIFKDDPRVDVNWGKMLDSFEELSGLPGANEFITYTDGPSPQELAQQQQQEQMELEKQKLAQAEQFKAADMEQAQMQQEQQANQPTINQGGMFQDPDVGQAAQVISSLK
jgi:hypothetical protein